MTCREVIEFLDRYVGGELAPAEHAAFEGHIAGCAACIAYLESYERSLGLTKDAFDDDDEIPDELVEAILAAIKRKEG